MKTHTFFALCLIALMLLGASGCERRKGDTAYYKRLEKGEWINASTYAHPELGFTIQVPEGAQLIEMGNMDSNFEAGYKYHYYGWELRNRTTSTFLLAKVVMGNLNKARFTRGTFANILDGDTTIVKVIDEPHWYKPRLNHMATYTKNEKHGYLREDYYGQGGYMLILHTYAPTLEEDDPQLSLLSAFSFAEAGNYWKWGNSMGFWGLVLCGVIGLFMGILKDITSLTNSQLSI